MSVMESWTTLAGRLQDFQRASVVEEPVFTRWVPTRQEVRVMSEGGREPVEAMRIAGDTPAEVDRTEALSERLFGNALGALELYTIYLGERLGLYQALAEGGAATSSQLAARTGTTERYVREWLEHHAASELLVVDDPRADPLARRYWLPRSTFPSWQTPTTSDTRLSSASTSSAAVAGFRSWWGTLRRLLHATVLRRGAFVDWWRCPPPRMTPSAAEMPAGPGA